RRRRHGGRFPTKGLGRRLACEPACGARPSTVPASASRIVIMDGCYSTYGIVSGPQGSTQRRESGPAAASASATAASRSCVCSRWAAARSSSERYEVCIPGQLSALERADDRISVANLAPRGVDQVGAALHLGDQPVVEQM